ncbi:MAG: SH3 domain-containing protein [Chloroflexi bacterium]|nr:SH3 domain-containing protein [Chloroflexota bacterium]
MKRLFSIMLTLAAFSAVPAMAADCPALVQQALAATGTMCGSTAKNEACYGNINLTATPTFGVQNFRFSQPGDRVAVSDIKSLQLSPMTVDTGEWGVALMNIEANLPAAKPATVTLLAFGDVMLENAAAVPTLLDVQVTSSNPINVRQMPNMNAGVIGSLQPDQTVTALERIVDGSWLRVQLPDSEQMGWVSSEFITASGDLRTLNIVEGTQPHYRPMQAFTFRSGKEGTQGCTEIPEDGLIIQTPEGAGEVQLWINEVVVKLGSTVYFQAQPNSDMRVTTLEGHATVESQGITYTAAAGSSLSVPLDADMRAAAPPTMPVAYEMAAVAGLPVDQLPREISIHEPLTAAEIAGVQKAHLGNAANAAPTESAPPASNGQNNSGNNSGNNNPPPSNPPANPQPPAAPAPPNPPGNNGHNGNGSNGNGGNGHNNDDDGHGNGNWNGHDDDHGHGRGHGHDHHDDDDD